jgi:hypothetical protein
MKPLSDFKKLSLIPTDHESTSREIDYKEAKLSRLFLIDRSKNNTRRHVHSTETLKEMPMIQLRYQSRKDDTQIEISLSYLLESKKIYELIWKTDAESAVDSKLLHSVYHLKVQQLLSDQVLEVLEKTERNFRQNNEEIREHSLVLTGQTNEELQMITGVEVLQQLCESLMHKLDQRGSSIEDFCDLEYCEGQPISYDEICQILTRLSTLIHPVSAVSIYEVLTNVVLRQTFLDTKITNRQLCDLLQLDNQPTPKTVKSQRL